MEENAGIDSEGEDIKPVNHGEPLDAMTSEEEDWLKIFSISNSIYQQ